MPNTKNSISLATSLINIISDNLWRRKNLVSRNNKKCSLPVQKTISQRIVATVTVNAKLHNIKKAVSYLEGLEIKEGQTLSFWHVVGKAGKKQDFALGSAIVKGGLSYDYGGGLCQLACIIYELALRCNLDIIERHGHSTNIYTPETSYTELGLDATLVYKSKDLRIRNPYPFSCHFSFIIKENQLTASLCASQPFPTVALQVIHKKVEDGLVADVFRQEKDKLIKISSDFYRDWNE
jgi:vancomycin resistance protein VanW